MLSVKTDGRLTAAVLAYKAAPKQVQSIIGKDTVAAFSSDYRADIRQAGAALTGPFVPFTRTGAAVKGRNPPELRAYQGRRRLRGGANAAEHGRSFEWGTPRRMERTQQVRGKSRAGKAYRYERHTGRQMPAPKPKGYAVAPVNRETGRRVVAFWVASIVRAYRRAADGERA